MEAVRVIPAEIVMTKFNFVKDQNHFQGLKPFVFIEPLHHNVVDYLYN